MTSITSATTKISFPDLWEPISKEWIATSGSEVPNPTHDMNDRVNRFQASAQRFSQVVCASRCNDDIDDDFEIKCLMSSLFNHAKEIANLSSQIHDNLHYIIIMEACTNSPEKILENKKLGA